MAASLESVLNVQMLCQKFNAFYIRIVIGPVLKSAGFDSLHCRTFEPFQLEEYLFCDITFITIKNAIISFLTLISSDFTFCQERWRSILIRADLSFVLYLKKFLKVFCYTTRNNKNALNYVCISELFMQIPATCWENIAELKVSCQH